MSVEEKGVPGGSMVKNSPPMQEPWERFIPWVGKIPWERKWQHCPVFLPEKSYGQRNMAGYNPWGHKESDKI